MCYFVKGGIVDIDFFDIKQNGRYIIVYSVNFTIFTQILKKWRV